MKKLATYLLFLSLIVAPTTANADILNYVCAVDDLKLAIRVNTEAQSVTQSVESGSTTAVAKYSDGVFGTVSHIGVASLIPPVHQFVRLSDDKIYYGGELHGIEDGVVLDRRLNTVTLPNGRSGWCTLLAPAKDE